MSARSPFQLARSKMSSANAEAAFVAAPCFKLELPTLSSSLLKTLFDKISYHNMWIWTIFCGNSTDSNHFIKLFLIDDVNRVILLVHKACLLGYRQRQVSFQLHL